MKINYTLLETDYLNFQLYIDSKNTQRKKQRRILHITLPVFALLGAVIDFGTGKTSNGIVWLCIGFFYFLLYPKFMVWSAKCSYKKAVERNYGSSPPKEIKMEITKDFIESFDIKGDSRIKTAELERFAETGEYFYIQISKPIYFVIPKHQLANIDAVRNELVALSQIHAIPFDYELDWCWK